MTNVIKLRNFVILSERSESKNLPIYGLLIRNYRAKILRLAALAQDDILNLVALGSVTLPYKGGFIFHRSYFNYP